MTTPTPALVELRELVDQLDRMAAGIREAIPNSPRRRRRDLNTRADAFDQAARLGRVRLSRVTVNGRDR